MTAPFEVAYGVWVLTGTGRPSTHPDDLSRAAALPAWRAGRFLRGRGLLRALLHTVAPATAGAGIVPDRRGRPRLAGFPQAGISISHSDGVAACAFAPDRPTGVDLQHPSVTAGPVLARRLLRSHAPAVLALPPMRAAREVAWVWTAQEACVKAAGTGLAGRPWDIDVPPGRRTGTWGAYRWVCLRDHSDIPLSCAYGPSGPPARFGTATSARPLAKGRSDT
ncbi:4'-phosphopantetheinyl transferase family protein [Streptomyces massasporeus]|uniref:4'-phosphopantetheinyl transferase family protein n=1 Tax=Streptomyces massasporeus TaxID=67324 RepID=UPI00331D995A